MSRDACRRADHLYMHVYIDGVIVLTKFVLPPFQIMSCFRILTWHLYRCKIYVFRKAERTYNLDLHLYPLVRGIQ